MNQRPNDYAHRVGVAGAVMLASALAACAQDFAVASYVDQVARSDQDQSDLDQRLRRTQHKRVFGKTSEEMAHPLDKYPAIFAATLAVAAVSGATGLICFGLQRRRTRSGRDELLWVNNLAFLLLLYAGLNFLTLCAGIWVSGDLGVRHWIGLQAIVIACLIGKLVLGTGDGQVRSSRPVVAASKAPFTTPPADPAASPRFVAEVFGMAGSRTVLLICSVLYVAVTSLGIPTALVYTCLAALHRSAPPSAWRYGDILPVPSLGMAVALLVVVAILWTVLRCAVKFFKASSHHLESAMSDRKLLARYKLSRALSATFRILFGLGLLLCAVAMEFLSFDSARWSLLISGFVALGLGLAMLAIEATVHPLTEPDCVRDYERARQSRPLAYPYVTLVAVGLLSVTLILEPILLSRFAAAPTDWYGPFRGMYAFATRLPQWVPAGFGSLFARERGGLLVLLLLGVPFLLSVLATVWSILYAWEPAGTRLHARKVRLVVFLLPFALFPGYLGLNCLSPFQSAYVHILTIMSAATLVLYATDKRRAIEKGDSVSRIRQLEAALEDVAEPYDDEQRARQRLESLSSHPEAELESLEARRHALQRVPESSLHGASLSGGWPGAWLAMWLFNHKTAKREFQSVFRVSVVLHCILVSLIIWCTYLYTLVAQLVDE